MFIDEKILTKLMKRAYKGNGVFMAREDGWYYLKGGYWDAKIAVGCMPRSVLGLMIQMCGAIPEEGERWTSDKDQDQFEMFLGGLEMPKQRIPMFKRRVALLSPGGTPMQVLQLENDAVMYFSMELLAAANPACLDTENQESNLTGPFYDGEHGTFWETNQAVWHIIQLTYDDLNSIVDYLSDTALEIEEPE